MHDAVIAGAGPVGLYLARRLQHLGWTVRVLEAQPDSPSGSRAIGLHAGALTCLAKAGVAEDILRHAVGVRQAPIYWEGEPIGVMDFAGAEAPYNLVAMNQQADTLARLGEGLTCVERGVTVSAFTEHGDRVTIETSAGTCEASWLIAADGHQSRLREHAGIGFPGRTYPDRYMMGDFRDDTAFGEQAVIFLGQTGLVESFPLPGGVRRWVVKLTDPVDEPSGAEVAAAVFDRTGQPVAPETCTMLSSFRTHGRLAERLWAGRLLLVGDAAHVVSPIGGQGMNLGWINAERLVEALQDGTAQALERWAHTASRAARRARQRAVFNMWMGRSGGNRWSRRLLLALILHPPASLYFRRAFTMRDL